MSRSISTTCRCLSRASSGRVMAQAGADFDHAFVGGRVNGVHDVLDGARVLQEVLAEAFAGNVSGHGRLVSVWVMDCADAQSWAD